MPIRRPIRPAGKKSNSTPVFIGAAVLGAVLVFLAMRGGGNPAKGVEAVANQVAPPAPPRDEVAEKGRQYVSARSKELLQDSLHGMGSSQVGEEFMGRMRGQAEEQASREWATLVVILREAEIVGGQKNELEAYRRAADYVWEMHRPMARFVDTPLRPEDARAGLELAIDRARLDVRIGR